MREMKEKLNKSWAVNVFGTDLTVTERTPGPADV